MCKGTQISKMEERNLNGKTFDARFASNFGMILSGPPMAGKTHFVLNLLKHSNRLLSCEFDYIYWFYGERNKDVIFLEKEYENKIKTIKGLPQDIENYIEFEGQRRGLHIYDDLMGEISTSTMISDLTSKKCQHNCVSWILIMQNMFHNGKQRISILRNAHYLVLFNNPLDKSVVQYMANRVMPQNQKVFKAIFAKAANHANGYLFIDGCQKTPEIARFRTNIFDFYQKVFIPITN